MLIDEKEALKRLESPMNLMNRLNKRPVSRAMSLFVPSGREAEDKRDINTNDRPLIPAVRNPFIKPVHDSVEESESNPSNPPEKPSEENSPNLDNLLNDADGQIKLAAAHNKALEVLNRSVDMMMMKLDDIKPDKLPSVISATSKVVEGIRRERTEANKARQGAREVHHYFYTPVQKKIEEYEVIDVG